MSDRWAKRALRLYKVAGSVAYPVMGGYLAWRARKGKEDVKRRSERFGKTSIPRPDGPLIWVHAASVGETVAISALLDRLREAGLNLLLTTGTVTSAELAGERFKGKLIHQFAPLDIKPAMKRFLNYWKPDLAIMAESEIWPLTIQELAKRNIPQLLVNARLSDRSFASWSKRKKLAELVFGKFAHVIAQSEDDGQRYAALGAQRVTVSGNLKVDVNAPPVNEALVETYAGQIGKRTTWAAVSTHDGEETAVADIHTALKRKFPDLLTVLVPRHPVRADEIVTMLTARGLKVAKRSADEKVSRSTDIFLGDTIGEMGFYLSLAEIAFVGGSLGATGAGIGGHNLLEPAMLGAAVLTGDQLHNQRGAYAQLSKAGAAIAVSDAAELEQTVSRLFSDANARRAMIDAGARAITEMRGTLDRTMVAIDPHIRPLILQARLSDVSGA